MLSKKKLRVLIRGIFLAGKIGELERLRTKEKIEVTRNDEQLDEKESEERVPKR